MWLSDCELEITPVKGSGGRDRVLHYLSLFLISVPEYNHKNMLSSKGCKVRRPKVTLKLKPHNQIGKSTPHHSCSPNSAAAPASQPSIFSGPSASSVLSGALPSLPYDGSNKQPRSVADLPPHDASFKGDHRSPPGVPPSTHTIQRILQDNTVGTIMASSKRPRDACWRQQVSADPTSGWR